MNEQPTTREHLPWSMLFAVIGAASGVAEGKWLQLHLESWAMISTVLAMMGWGLGFDVANRRRAPASKTQFCIFATIAALLFILVTAMCGGAGVLFNTAIAPRFP